MWNTALHLAGPFILLVGVFVGMWGTLLMCQPYHPYRKFAVAWPILRAVGWVLRGKTEKVVKELETTSEIATVNAEQRARSLAGVFLLIFSFMLQTAGSALCVVDAWVTRAR